MPGGVHRAFSVLLKEGPFPLESMLPYFHRAIKTQKLKFFSYFVKEILKSASDDIPSTYSLRAGGLFQFNLSHIN